ncbi:MAG: hypothetical protein K1X95_07170 [Acidimicrobiia bacterium]|nr:hypothetical protein [Acidimicrobiia bacterium]
MRRLLVAMTIALTTIGLAACSSSKEASSEGDTSAPASTAAPSSGSSTGGSEFCQQVAQVGQQYAESFKSVQEPPKIDPTNPQAALTQTQEIGRKLAEPMQQIQAIAPPEIKSDVDALVSGFEALASGNPEALATAGTQMQQAGQNFAQYLAANCGGTNLGGLGTTSGSSSGSGTGSGTGTATGPN